MNRELVVTWKNSNTGRWTPVGKLSYKNRTYYFEYTELAKKAINLGELSPFINMDDTNKIHTSKKLFPVFENRLLAKSRPEYSNFYDWLKLSEGSTSPLDELAMSGGIRATDNFQLFLIPKPSLNRYVAYFFSHGIRHLAPSYIDRLRNLKKGDRLLLLKDVQNPFDSSALAIRTEDPPELVGYTPRFFTRDFNKLIESNGSKNVEISVEKLNLDAPKQYRLLCKISTQWPDGFVPFDNLTNTL